jgi:hypothetical protein
MKAPIPPTAESGVKRLGMVSSTATTPQQYLASLPEDRREVIAGVRKLLLDNLPEGVEENMNFGMLSYEIPFATYPDTHNKRPLMFAALAAQKHYFSRYWSNHPERLNRKLRKGQGEAQVIVRNKEMPL